MPRLTPEAFSKLDLQEQARILQRVPVEKLNNLHFIQLDENTSGDEVAEVIRELVETMPPDTHILVITRLLEILATYANEDAEKEGLECPPKKVAMVLLLVQAINGLKKDLAKALGEETDGDEEL